MKPDESNTLVCKALLLAKKSAVAAIACTASLAACAQVVLITDEEARSPDAQILSTRAITRGPAIKLLTPSEVTAKLFAIKIDLEARGGAKIDSNSLKVEYLKQPLIDLTSRFKPGMRGNHIELPQVRVPEGQHAIRVSIKDSEGREASQLFQLHAK